jgi:hypothetical protein
MYGEIKNFIASHKSVEGENHDVQRKFSHSLYPNLKVEFKQGSPPTLTMLSLENEAKETLMIGEWKEHTINDYLKGRLDPQISTSVAWGDEFDCKDVHKNCEDWAKNGECEKNPEYMKKDCQKSCNICGGGATPDAEAAPASQPRSDTVDALADDDEGLMKAFETEFTCRQVVVMDATQCDELDDNGKKVRFYCKLSCAAADAMPGTSTALEDESAGQK